MNPDFVNRNIGETLAPDAWAMGKLIGDTGQHFKDHLLMGGEFNDKVGTEITERLAGLLFEDAKNDYANNRTHRYPPELTEARLVMILNAANSLFKRGELICPFVRVDMKTQIIDMPIGCYLTYKQGALSEIFKAARENAPRIEMPPGEQFDRAKHLPLIEARFTDQLVLEARNYCLAAAKLLTETNGEPQFRPHNLGGMKDAIPKPRNQGCGCTSLVLLIGLGAAAVYFTTRF